MHNYALTAYHTHNILTGASSAVTPKLTADTHKTWHLEEKVTTVPVTQRHSNQYKNMSDECIKDVTLLCIR